MKISENLKKLLERHNLNTLELSRRTGIAQPVIYRLLTGETLDPKITTVLALANYFGLTLDQFIEEPFSWSNKKSLCFEIPLLTWKQMSEWSGSLKNTPAYAEKTLIDFKPISNIFALRANDDSMLPAFAKGTLLVVNGDQNPTDGDFIVAKTRAYKNILFRQLLVDGKTQYLRPVNPDTNKYRTSIFDKKRDTCCGVLIQSKTDYI